MTGPERRRNQRVNVRLETILELSRSVKTHGVCENLSAKGLFFACDPKPQVGALCTLVLRLGDDRYHPSIRIQGKVVRADDRGVGIEFLAIDFHDFEHLKNIVLYSATDPDKVEAEFRQYLELYRLDQNSSN